MALTRTEAVVLKSTAYSETSKICRLYTLSYGLQSLIAKGVRRSKHRMSGTLETLNHVEVLYYKRKNRSLFTLSQVTAIETFNGLTLDIRRFYRAVAVAEVILRLGNEEEGSTPIFQLLIHALRSFSKRPVESLGERMLSYFWGILIHLGYAPRLESCASCGGPVGEEEVATFSVAAGGVFCPRCRIDSQEDTYSLSKRVSGILFPKNVGSPVGLRGHEEDVLMQLTEAYIHYHVQDRRPLVCWDFLRSLPARK